MKTVKVTVKREQFFEQLCAKWGTLDYRAFSPKGEIVDAKVGGPLPLEFTLELPVEQIEVGLLLNEVVRGSGVKCVRCINRIEGQSLDLLKSKRKRFKIVGPEGGLMLAAGLSHSNLRWIKEIELEEVE